MQVLLVGVGGLGGSFLSVLLQDTTHIAIDELCIVDPDTISEHTPSRHPLFTSSTVGRLKAEEAKSICSEHFNANCYSAPIESFDLSFFGQFDIVILAVDNLPSRRHVNAAVRQSFAKYGRPSCLIEGGTEDWMGHARILFSNLPGCIECTAGLYSTLSLRPICADTDRVTEAVIVTAPFVNSVIGVLMVSQFLQGTRDLHNFMVMYNATTAFLGSVSLTSDPDCPICAKLP